MNEQGRVTKEQAIAELRRLLANGEKLTAKRIGGSADYQVFEIRGDHLPERLQPAELTKLIAKASGFRFDNRLQGLGVGGLGSDPEGLKSAMDLIAARLSGVLGMPSLVIGSV